MGGCQYDGLVDHREHQVLSRPDRLQNGKFLPPEAAGIVSQFGETMGTVSATLYRATTPYDPVLLHGNRLCGGPVTFVAVWKPAPVASDIDPRAMAARSGSARPAAAGGPNFCGTYNYEAGRR
jgi:hypothetical protein